MAPANPAIQLFSIEKSHWLGVKNLTRSAIHGKRLTVESST
jgi:hypothetical protein